MNLQRVIWLMLFAACALIFVTPLLATSVAVDTSAYALVAWTAAPGGSAQGGAFTLDATAGQKDAGTLSGGAFGLSGGYWQRAADTDSLYFALIRK